MDEARLDGLTRSLRAGHSRRLLTRLLSGIVLAGPLAGLVRSETAAKKKRKKRKRKAGVPPPAQCPSPPLQCPPGQDACAGVCCSPDKTCLAGSCQCTTPCGAVCCLDGQVCLDATTHSCGCVAASCPVGCACGGAAGGVRVCYESVATDCEEVQFCASTFDCPPGSACNPLVCDSPICFPLGTA